MRLSVPRQLLFIVFLFALAGEAQNSSAPPARKLLSQSAAAAEAVRQNNLGTAYMNQQQFERALLLFRKARVLDPRLAAAKLNEAIALAQLQRYRAASSILETAIRADQENARLWYVLALVRKSQGNRQEALNAFLAAARLAPNDADVYYFIGLMQSELDHQQEAVAAFQHALELNSFHASAEFGLARSFQRLGETGKAQEHLARFQHVVQAKLGVPMGLAYGDQGPLSLALQVAGAARPAATPIAVHFTDITKAAGLSAFSPAGPADSIGAGACFFDFDNDGRPDLFLARGGVKGGIALFHNVGGKFEEITQKAGLDPGLRGIACAAGDYNNDGRVDLAVTTANGVLLYHNQGNGTFKDATEASGIRMQGLPLALTFVDYDHDGDLDLFVTSREAGRTTLWRNNGNSTFTDVTTELGLSSNAPVSGVAMTDFNNDRAIDLIFTGGRPELFLNPREGHWKPAAIWDGKLPAATSAVVFDFDKDGWMDIAVAYDGAPGIILWRNLNGKAVEQAQLPVKNWRRAWGLAALDYDNDGWIDLAAAGETEDGRAEVRLFRNAGNNAFVDVTAEVGLDAIAWASPRALAAVDVDGDGATDLMITQAEGPPVLLRNQGGNRNHFLHLALKGHADNKNAVGTKLEVFAGALWQKFEIGGPGYLGQSAVPLVVGLGKESRLDIVRTLWPTGVVQDEAQFAANTSQKINEIDRRGSSCPVLFAWDGARYRFIADTLGAGVVGHWVGPGERNIPDSTEYIKVEGGHVRARNGSLSFRFMEPLEEVVYLDQVRLLAIDHPGDVAVFPNEYFASNPPFPDFKVIASRHARPLAGAWDDDGNDVLPLLREVDQRYVNRFEILPYAGFTKPHSLKIELPEAYQGGPLRLLFHGYIEYFSATSMYAAWQAGINPFAPYLEAQDAQGKWVRVMDDMGFPAGLPRTTVADLTDKLPRGTRFLRMTTNLQIYWDQLLVDTTSAEDGSNRVTPVPLRTAKLAFHGYPRLVNKESPGDFTFFYEQASPTGPYMRPVGAYTRLGDVRTLLLDSDDRFVVFGSGDEVQLDFDPAGLPPLPRNWARDYFFFVDGYEKDMDFYAATGNFVTPLPFHRMKAYPYVNESYPQDELHSNDLLNYDDRFFSTIPSSSFRFHYPKRRSNGAR